VIRLSVCLSALKTTFPNFTKFFVHFTCDRRSEDNAVRYVLPV